MNHDNRMVAVALPFSKVVADDGVEHLREKAVAQKLGIKQHAGDGVMPGLWIRLEERGLRLVNTLLATRRPVRLEVVGHSLLLLHLVEVFREVFEAYFQP